MDTETVLEITKLKKEFRNNRGIHDVSFSVQRGDILGFLGANGSGKTTTMKVIMSLSKKDSGEVRLFGKDAFMNQETTLNRVGALVEIPAFYGFLSAESNLKIASRYYDIPVDIDKILGKVGLLQFKKEQVGKFSLGMKQRMGLALSMVGDPDLYILDEPSNGLDIEGVVEIRNIILELAKKQGGAFVLSSHISSEIQKVCNKVGIIYDGYMDGVKPMSEILENYPTLEDYYLQYVTKMRGGLPK